MFVAFSCKTQLQVLSCLGILSEYIEKFENVVADLYLTDDRFSADYVKNLSNSGAFRHVELMPRLPRNGIFTFSPKILSRLKLIDTLTKLKPLKSYLHLDSKLYNSLIVASSIKERFQSYDELFLNDPFGISFSLILLTKKDCLISQYDEGIGSYIDKFTKRFDPQKIHLFCPQLSQHSHKFKINLCAIPKLNRTNHLLIKWLRSIYPNITDNIYLPKEIYFDQPYGESKSRDFEVFLSRLDILKEFFHKRKNVAFCPHPSSKRDVLDKYITPIVKQSEQLNYQVPFEVLLLLSKQTPSKIYSINSTAVTHWKLMLDIPDQIDVFILDPIFRQKCIVGHDNDVIKFMSAFAEMYPDSVHLIQTFDELAKHSIQ